MSNRSLATVLGALVCFQAGLLMAQLSPRAWAQETPPVEEPAVETDAAFYDPPRLYCRIFETALKGAGTTFETNDRTTEIGKWIAEEEESYQLFTIDFEVGQKGNGYPQGFTQVCLSPR